MSHARVAYTLPLLALVGCLSPVEISTAYDDEVYLCGDATLYAERVAACRAQRAAGEDCSGVLSFEGDLDGVAVVVDAEVVQVDMASLRLPDATLVRDSLDLFGNSPYFSFRLSLGSLADADTRPDGDVTQTIRQSPPCDDGTRDDLVKLSLRVIAAGGSSDDTLSSGTFTMTRQTPLEHVGSFDSTFRDGRPFRGCFTVFTDNMSVEQLQPCD